MIVGLLRWNDPDTYYSQENNPTEQVLKKLESCGPTSATMICAATGAHVDIITPGGYKPQSEEVLCDYMNDRRNYDKLRAARPDLVPGTYLGNEIPQYYTVSVPEVFGVGAQYREGISLDGILLALKDNRGTMVCLKSPGHFLAVVAFDDATGELIYNDPWAGDPWPMNLKGTPGFNRRMSAQEFLLNCKPFRVEIGGRR
jgi:hypothetical protein